MAWKHLATAPDQLTAEFWVSLLREEDLAARIRPSDAVSFLGVSGYGCRVEVQDSEIERAREVLGEDAAEGT
jgi:hypothetical protein